MRADLARRRQSRRHGALVAAEVPLALLPVRLETRFDAATAPSCSCASIRTRSTSTRTSRADRGRARLGPPATSSASARLRTATSHARGVARAGRPVRRPARRLDRARRGAADPPQQRRGLDARRADERPARPLDRARLPRRRAPLRRARAARSPTAAVGPDPQRIAARRPGGAARDGAQVAGRLRPRRRARAWRCGSRSPATTPPASTGSSCSACARPSDAAESATPGAALLDAHHYTGGARAGRRRARRRTTRDPARSGWGAAGDDPAASLRNERGGRRSADDASDGDAAGAGARDRRRPAGPRRRRRAATTGVDARQMRTALWPATWGYMLEQLAGRRRRRRHRRRPARTSSRTWPARGALPTLRLGRQPYGVLPVTSLAAGGCSIPPDVDARGRRRCCARSRRPGARRRRRCRAYAKAPRSATVLAAARRDEPGVGRATPRAAWRCRSPTIAFTFDRCSRRARSRCGRSGSALDPALARAVFDAGIATPLTGPLVTATPSETAPLPSGAELHRAGWPTPPRRVRSGDAAGRRQHAAVRAAAPRAAARLRDRRACASCAPAASPRRARATSPAWRRHAPRAVGPAVGAAGGVTAAGQTLGQHLDAVRAASSAAGSPAAAQLTELLELHGAACASSPRCRPRRWRGSPPACSTSPRTASTPGSARRPRAGSPRCARAAGRRAPRRLRRARGRAPAAARRAAVSHGYIHAPSLGQAATAAVLRSGHLAHAGGRSAARGRSLVAARAARARAARRRPRRAAARRAARLPLRARPARAPSAGSSSTATSRRCGRSRRWTRSPRPSTTSASPRRHASDRRTRSDCWAQLRGSASANARRRISSAPHSRPPRPSSPPRRRPPRRSARRLEARRRNCRRCSTRPPPAASRCRPGSSAATTIPEAGMTPAMRARLDTLIARGADAGRSVDAANAQAAASCARVTTLNAQLRTADPRDRPARAGDHGPAAGARGGARRRRRRPRTRRRAARPGSRACRRRCGRATSSTGSALRGRWRTGVADARWDVTTIPFGDARRAARALARREQQAIDAELRALDDAVDALADLLVAESVHQVVQGNPQRAGATRRRALARRRAAARRRGRAHAARRHRASPTGCSCSPTRLAPPPDGRPTRRRSAPRSSRRSRRGRRACSARRRACACARATPGRRRRDRDDRPQRAPAVRARRARDGAGRRTRRARPRSSRRCSTTSPARGPRRAGTASGCSSAIPRGRPTQLGLAEFLELARARARAARRRARRSTPRDLALPGVRPTGADRRRRPRGARPAIATGALDDARAALAAALAGGSRERAAAPRSRAAASSASIAPPAAARRARRARPPRRAPWRRPRTTDAARVAAVLGDGFRLLPRVTAAAGGARRLAGGQRRAAGRRPARGGHLAAARRARARRARRGWRPRCSTPRRPAARSRCGCASPSCRARAGDRWAGAARDAAAADRRRAAVARRAGGRRAAGRRRAARRARRRRVDRGRSRTRTQVTGLSFHVDQPNCARAAGDPARRRRRPRRTSGACAALEATVLETLDLARLRLVDAEALARRRRVADARALAAVPRLGHYLPAIYLAAAPAADTVTTDLGRVVAARSCMAAEPTRWARLEPRSRDRELAPGLEARVHDPLWLLGRQWQFGELDADGDAAARSSPRSARRSRR